MSKESNYWQRTLTERRLRRRRLLQGVAVGAMGAGALSLVGCGGGDTGDIDEQTAAPTLLTQLQETTAEGKPGGNWPHFLDAEPPGFDARSSIVGGTLVVVAYVYSRLLKSKPSVLEPFANIVEGDIIKEWEQSDDGLQLTMKVDPAARWDPRQPTNGRKVTAEDVALNWEHFAANHVSAGELANSASPNAPIESVVATDNETVVMKLAFPLGSLLQSLAWRTFYIYPKESFDGKYDARTQAYGSGAWRLADWEPSVSVEFERNDDWHGNKKPFLDTVTLHIIPEQAQRLAQFRARALLAASVQQEDVLATKQSIPQLVMYQQPITRIATRWQLSYGYSGASGEIFADERVRQAISMGFDREAFLDAFTNTREFEGKGLTVNRFYHSHLYAAEPEWIDPFSEEIGEGGKFFRYDVAEAKKLLAAAGYPDGFEVVHNQLINAYPPEFFRMVDATLPMFADLGIRAVRRERDYSSDYLPNVFYAKGEYDGIGMNITNAYADSVEYLFGCYHPDGGRSIVRRGLDPKLEEEIVRVRRELDNERRTEMLKDLQRYMAVLQPALGTWGAGVTDTFDVKWPEAENVGVYFGASEPQEVMTYYWINDSKKS